MDPKDWAKLVSAVEEIQEWFPDGIAFIGGIAVYAHAMSNEGGAELAAYSHDADFVMMLPEFADLRDLEVVTANPRMTKYQFIKSGFEFDVYVEHQSGLEVPVDEVVAGSVLKSGLRVASLEHLLILKLDAYHDRKGSAKGEKDEDDLVRILRFIGNPEAELLKRLKPSDVPVLEKIAKSDAVTRIMQGNNTREKTFRDICLQSVGNIRAVLRDENDDFEP